jgi:hypothetical protein
MTGILQDRLLQAAFLQNEKGLQAWQAWKAMVDLDGPLHPGTFRLLPLIYRNLYRQEIDDPLLMKIKGVSHKNWTRNILALQALAQPLRGFESDGIKFIALGGLAFILQGHPDYSAYPPDQYSILVKPEKANFAIQRLRNLGWIPSPDLPQTLDESLIAAKMFQTFYCDSGKKIRLYWQLLSNTNQSPADETLWIDALTVHNSDLTALTLNPADQLLYILQKDRISIRPSFFLQAVDTMLVLEANLEGVNWERLIGLAQEHRLLYQLQRIVGYLQDLLEVAELQTSLTGIRKLPVARSERFIYHFSFHRFSSLDHFPYAWFYYIQHSHRKPRWERVLGFLNLLWLNWHWRYLWLFPAFVLVFGMDKIRRMVKISPNSLC